MLAEIKRLHPYELPALLVLPTEGGSAEYCGWNSERDGRRRATMSGERLVLAIDQGTTSTRAILFDRDGQARASAQVPLTQIYPAPGQVEHDPEEIWRSVLDAGRAALRDIEPAAIAGTSTSPISARRRWFGSGRREGHPPTPSSGRTAVPHRFAVSYSREGWGDHVAHATGLVIDPYFSATKLAWLLRECAGP